MKREKRQWQPRYLTERAMAAAFVAVVCLFMAAGVVDRYLQETGSPYIAAVVAAVLTDLLNEDRASLALSPLRVNPKLVAAAQAKANDMAERGYFAHTSPDGKTSWYWFEAVGYEYAYAGENLAVDFSESGDVQRAWMRSPTHRANIANGNYTEIGIATARGSYKGHETVFAVQMFGRPSAQEVARAVGAPPAMDVPAPPPDVRPVVSSATSTEGKTLGLTARDEREVVAPLTPGEVPWWAYLAVQPKQTLRYAYYIVGLLILAALFLDMELELRWHHVRHAMKAGVALVTMSMLFVAADWLFFAEPILAFFGL